MGSELAEKYTASRQVFEEADDALGFAISQMCFQGTAEELQLTENTQPAILTTSIAVLRRWKPKGFPRLIMLPGIVSANILRSSLPERFGIDGCGQNGSPARAFYAGGSAGRHGRDGCRDGRGFRDGHGSLRAKRKRARFARPRISIRLIRLSLRGTRRRLIAPSRC